MLNFQILHFFVSLSLLFFSFPVASGEHLNHKDFPDFSPDAENLSPNPSPARGGALIFPPSLLGKGVRGLGFPLVFTHDLRSQVDSLLPLKHSKENPKKKKPVKIIQPNQRTTEAKSFCSQQNIETLTTPLMRDLPSYTNRASQRARRLSRKADVYSYMIVAGKPDFTPLPFNSGTNNTDASKSSDEKVEQIFFTTLERQYISGKAVQLQEFHWLFLTNTKSGWRMVTMFSQIGSYPVTKQPPTPPRDSSNGTVAQGINAWLRDCRAGTVRMSGKYSI